MLAMCTNCNESHYTHAKRHNKVGEFYVAITHHIYYMYHGLYYLTYDEIHSPYILYMGHVGIYTYISNINFSMGFIFEK